MQNVSAAGFDCSIREEGRPSTGAPGGTQRSHGTAASLKGVAGGEGGEEIEGETKGSPEAPKPSSRHQRRTLGRDHATAAKGRKWKPNAKRPLKWFSVPGRQTFLVDPSDAKAVAAVRAAGTSASATGRARQADENHPSDRVDFGRVGLSPSAVGGGDGGVGTGVEPRGAGSRGNRTEQVGGGAKVPHSKEREGETEGEKQLESEGPRSLPERGGEGGGGGGGCDYSSQANSVRSNILLSARSALASSSAVSVEKLSSSLTTVVRSGARASGWAGSCMPLSRDGARRARGGWKKNIESPSVDISPREWSPAPNLSVNHSRSMPLETKLAVEQPGTSCRTPTATHGIDSRVVLRTPGGAIDPLAPENGIKNSPLHMQSRRGAGERNGVRIEACIPSAHQQQRGSAARADWLSNREGGLEISRVSLRPKERGRTPTTTATKDTATPGLQHQERRSSHRRSSNQPSAMVSGWGHVETNVGRSDGPKKSAPTPRGHGAGGSCVVRADGEDIANVRPMPVDSDDGLGECFSVSGTVVSSNSSCCGWNKTNSSQK